MTIRKMLNAEGSEAAAYSRMGRILFRKVGTFVDGTESRSSPEEHLKLASMSLNVGAALTVSVTMWRLRLRTQPEASQRKLVNDGAVKQG